MSNIKRYTHMRGVPIGASFNIEGETQVYVKLPEMVIHDTEAVYIINCVFTIQSDDPYVCPEKRVNFITKETPVEYWFPSIME